MDQLVNEAMKKLNIKKGSSKSYKLYNKDGGELDDIRLVRDNDVLYLSGDERIAEDWITLNVGGRCFTTSKSTLTAKEPNSMLARMFSDLFTPSNIDAKGAYLIDRSPTYFEPILNYLRNGQLIYDTNVNPEGILEEAKFFGVDSIVPMLEQAINDKKKERDDFPLTRRDIINAIIMCPSNTELRFQVCSRRWKELPTVWCF